ncbi:hypothetical protein O6H91_12G096400 [Diphasiastrum complanatum]|uniref:Uncharacterized protein n=1 Tax=Diphasiastrum complanatum TaxID=34168 RepID=A0ACC2C4W6_DIPCM|nr:hypothetical protein O6H91_12G096400 [Diphasiastrum complanatum]
MDGLQNAAPAPFLTKTFDMVDDSSTDEVVSWGGSGNTFVVWNPPDFARDLLPKHFKHNNFSSFVRQLNTYGFRKVDPDRWEFANEGFLQGQRHLLNNIHRRKPATHHQPPQGTHTSNSPGACVEVGKFGLEGEVERLKRDKNVLMAELVRLRQQQQQSERELQMMGQRLHVTEQRQQQMVSFLARAVQNPAFLSQLVQKNETNNRLATARKKRRLSKQEGDDGRDSNEAERQLVKYSSSANDNARTFMQFVNAADFASKMDVPLEVFFRDLDPGSGATRQETDRQSGVILTEMYGNSGVPDDLAVTEVPTEPIVQLPVPFLADLSKAEGVGIPLFPNELEANPVVNPSGREGDVLMPLDLGFGNNVDMYPPKEASPNTDIAVGLGGTDGFWEQFLTTDSRETETDPDADVSENTPR